MSHNECGIVKCGIVSRGVFTSCRNPVLSREVKFRRGIDQFQVTGQQRLFSTLEEVKEYTKTTAACKARASTRPTRYTKYTKRSKHRRNEIYQKNLNEAQRQNKTKWTRSQNKLYDARKKVQEDGKCTKMWGKHGKHGICQ